MGLAGLPAVADPEVSLDVAMKYAARRPVVNQKWRGWARKQMELTSISKKFSQMAEMVQQNEVCQDPQKNMDGPYNYLSG